MLVCLIAKLFWLFFVTVFSVDPPSEDFQNLLKCLLRKNPDERSGSSTALTATIKLLLMLFLFIFSQFRSSVKCS